MKDYNLSQGFVLRKKVWFALAFGLPNRSSILTFSTKENPNLGSAEFRGRRRWLVELDGA